MRDIAGAWLSFLCVLHCILPVILLSGGVSFGLHFAAEEMHETWLHTVLLLPVVAILAVSIPRAYKSHKNPQPAMVGVVGILTLIFGVTIGEHLETWFTVAGSILVITSHLLNRQSLKRNSLSVA